MTAKTYRVQWHNSGARGFGSWNAAQQFIDKICMVVAPDLHYAIEEEF